MRSQFFDNAQTVINHLKRYQALELATARLLGGWLPGIRRWEVKHDVGRHIWENAENSRALRTRLWELRINNPDRDVHEPVNAAFQEFAKAQHDYEMLAGIYLVLKPALLAAYQATLESTNHIYDYPSVPVLKRVLATTEEQIRWGQQTLNVLSDSGERKRNMRRWMLFAQEVVDAIGGVNGDGQPAGSMPPPPPAYSSPLPFPEAQRDERFHTQLDLAEMPARGSAAWTTWQFMGYATEMQAAETLASCLWEIDGMAWELYYDIARHCWDEVRHSQLGCQRLAQLGHHISDFPHPIGAYGWRQLYDPVIRYCALTYVIEAGSFPLKHETYQMYRAQGDLASAEAIMYDIVDETLHVRLGKKWVAPLMSHYGYTQTVDELVDECRLIVASHGTGLQKEGAERDIHKRLDNRTTPQ